MFINVQYNSKSNPKMGSHENGCLGRKMKFLDTIINKPNQVSTIVKVPVYWLDQLHRQTPLTK